MQRHSRHHRTEEGRERDSHAECRTGGAGRRAHRGTAESRRVARAGDRGAQAAREGGPRDQRDRAAEHRPGSARRSRPAARRALVPQLHAGEIPPPRVLRAGGKRRKHRRTARQGADTHAEPRPRAATRSTGIRRTDGGAQGTRVAKLRAVQAPLPAGAPEPRACARFVHRHAPLPDRAGRGDERRKARAREAHHHPALVVRRGIAALRERRRLRHEGDHRQARRHGHPHDEIPCRGDGRIAGIPPTRRRWDHRHVQDSVPFPTRTREPLT